MKKLLFLTVSVLLTSQMAMAKNIDSKTFIQCFEKAFNERVAEVKKENSKIAMCDGMTDEMRARLIDSYMYTDGRTNSRQYYSISDGERTVRFHYERLRHNFDCYDSKWQFPWLDHTNLGLLEETFTKILGQDMWTEQGYITFSKQNFDYCYQGKGE
jgi:hypothetical protein